MRVGSGAAPPAEAASRTRGEVWAGWVPGWLWLTFCWVVCALAAGPAGAQTLFQQVGIASSPNPVGAGARALGMGGAFIAVADDATAASWNPAGLIQLEQPEFSVVGAGYWRKEEFSSADRPEADNRAGVRERNLNHLSVSLPVRLGQRHLVLSVNYQRLYEFRREFSHAVDFSPSGLDLALDKNFRQDGFLGAFGLAAALQLTPRLSLGVVLNLWRGALGGGDGWRESYAERGEGLQGGVPLTVVTRSVDEYADFRGTNANLGLLWDVTRALTLGAVLKTPFVAKLDHSFRFHSVSTLATLPEPTVTRSDLQVREGVALRLPLSYGVGLAWRIADAWTLDLDVYRTHWSDYRLTDGAGRSFSPIDGRPADQSRVCDTTQVRLGSEVLWIGSRAVVPFRAGVFYDPQPAAGEVLDFYGVAVGSGLAWGRFAADVAYQFRWGRQVDTGNLIATTRGDVDQHALYASLIVYF